MSAKKRVFSTFRPFPCALRNHRNWLGLSQRADHLLRVLLTDDLLASPIPGVCVQAGLGLIAYCAREADLEVVRSTVIELEQAGLFVVDWHTMLIYCPDALRDSPHPRTLRALKAWEATWNRLPEGDVRDQLESDVAEILGAQKAKVAHAFEVMRRGVPDDEPKVAKKRGPKPGFRREKKEINSGEFSEQKKFEKTPSFSAETLAEFGETPRNSETPEFFMGPPPEAESPSNDFNDLHESFSSEKNNRNSAEFRDETRDWRLETRDENSDRDADASLSRLGALTASKAIPEPLQAANSEPAIEAQAKVTVLERVAPTESAAERRSAPLTPPGVQTPLFGPAANPPGGRSNRSKARKSPENDGLRHPELFHRVITEVNNARAFVNPSAQLHGLEVALPSAVHPLDRRLVELVASRGEERAFEIVCDVIWSRAWNLGIAQTHRDRTDAWCTGFKFLNLEAPFTMPGGWGMSESIRAQWIDAGRPEPTTVFRAIRDIRKGAISVAYDPKDFANIGRIQDEAEDRLMREYEEVMRREREEQSALQAKQGE